MRDAREALGLAGVDPSVALHGGRVEACLPDSADGRLARYLRANLHVTAGGMFWPHDLARAAGLVGAGRRPGRVVGRPRPC